MNSNAREFNNCSSDFMAVVERNNFDIFHNVYIYITEQCELKCKHCYLGNRLTRAKTMPAEKVFQHLKFWKTVGGKKLCLLGGEPTLHEDFFSIVEYANSLGYEKVVLNTNGLMSSRKKLNKIAPSDFSYIQVSLDGGSSQSHDLIRGTNTFDTTINTIKELCKIGFDTRIICTVNHMNLKDCLDIIPLAEELGVTVVKYHIFSGIGNGKENEKWTLTPREWIEFCEQLGLLKNKYGVQILYQPSYATRENIVNYKQEGYTGCIGRSLDRISIFPDGRAYVCSYLFDTSLNFINITDTGININNDKSEYDLFRAPGGCITCNNMDICSGGCPAEEVVQGYNPCKNYPDIFPVCRLWKSAI